LPEFGTLNMYYRHSGPNAGKYEMYYSSTPNNKLDIEFNVE